ncbi:MAG: tetratricopeptide repeat protein [Myxococcota bacterium]
MYVGLDDILEQCDGLDDTLAAARTALEQLAAQSLPFSAQLRVQHNSTRLAKRWVNVQGGVVVAAEETDEILRRTLASPLDDGPEGADDDLTALIDDTDTGIDPFDDIDMTLSDVDGDGDDGSETLHFDEDGLSASGPLIVFDDDDDDETAIMLDPTAEGGGDFLDDLSENLGDEPSTAGESRSFVTFDDGPELVSIGPSGDDDTPIDLGLDNTDQGDEQLFKTEAEADQNSGGDATLVADLESLVRLKDMIAEDSAAAHGQDTDAPADTAHVVDPARVSATTLTDDDLGKLGFGSAEDLVAPVGADADPNSETSPRPQVMLPTPEPAPTASKPKKSRSKKKKGASDDPDSAIGVGIPTIREQQSAGGPARPTAAAVRINPDGGGAILQEAAPLALGEADDPEEAAKSGFSLAVEEYELVEEEPAAAAAEPEPAPEPVAAPVLTDDEESALMRQAEQAHEKGELPRAADLYSDLLDFNPDNARAALGRGRVYLDLGDYARAMSDFTIAEDELPDDPDVNAAIGELYYARKDYSRAIEYFDTALENDPKHAMAWCRRGIAHYYRKDYDKAYENLVEAQKLDDKIPNIRTYIGMVKKKRK